MRAAPRQVRFIRGSVFPASAEQSWCAAGVPEQNRLILRELTGSNSCEQAAHRLGGVDGVEDDALPARDELERGRRGWSRNPVAVADETIIHLNRLCPYPAIWAPRRVARPSGPATPQRRRAGLGAGSSALTPITRARSPRRAHPAIMPACVPPEDEACTITSGLWPLAASSARPRANPSAPVGVDAPERHDERPPALGAKRVRCLFHRRLARLARFDVAHVGAEDPIEQERCHSRSRARHLRPR